MNLANEIDETLYSEITNNYEKGNYTGAILDSIMHLCSMIRERTGLQSDGVSLIGSAFGGNNPPLKVTQMRNQSERNIQKGIGNLLRGIIEAIRNPRSHEKITDTVEDTNAIIVFVDYILRQINKAKAPFTLDEYIKRVFDKDFVATREYSDLLVDEIPEKKIFEILMEIYNQKEKGKSKNLSLFFNSAFNLLNKKEQEAFIAMAGSELKTTNIEASIRVIVAFLGESQWGRIDRVARIRIENMLIRSISEGTYNKVMKDCTAGVFGTWLKIIINTMVCKSDFRSVLIKKLIHGTKFEQDYIFEYFNNYILQPDTQPEESLIEFLKQRLIDRDVRFYETLQNAFLTGFPDWAQNLRKNFEHFQPADFDDDIPF